MTSLTEYYTGRQADINVYKKAIDINKVIIRKVTKSGMVECNVYFNSSIPTIKTFAPYELDVYPD